MRACVARMAGVSPNAPYNHFADKAALLAAVAEEGLEALHDAMNAARARRRRAPSSRRSAWPM